MRASVSSVQRRFENSCVFIVQRKLRKLHGVTFPRNSCSDLRKHNEFSERKAVAQISTFPRRKVDRRQLLRSAGNLTQFDADLPFALPHLEASKATNQNALGTP